MILSEKADCFHVAVQTDNTIIGKRVLGALVTFVTKHSNTLHIEKTQTALANHMRTCIDLVNTTNATVSWGVGSTLTLATSKL